MKPIPCALLIAALAVTCCGRVEKTPPPVDLEPLAELPPPDSFSLDDDSLSLTSGLLVAEAPSLGIAVVDLDRLARAGLGLPEDTGLGVLDLDATGPLALAGTRLQDVLVAWNDEPLKSREQFETILSATAIGSEIRLTVLRDGQRQIVTTFIADAALSDWRPNQPNFEGASEISILFDEAEDALNALKAGFEEPANEGQ